MCPIWLVWKYWANIRLVNYLSELWKGCGSRLTAWLVLSDLKAEFDLHGIFDYHDMVLGLFGYNGSTAFLHRPRRFSPPAMTDLEDDTELETSDWDLSFVIPKELGIYANPGYSVRDVEIDMYIASLAEHPERVVSSAKTLLKWCVGRVEGIVESYDRLKSLSPRTIVFWHFWELWINEMYNGFDISQTVVGDSPEFLSAISSLATSYPHPPEARARILSKEEFLETVSVNLEKLGSLYSKTIFRCIVERHHWLVRFGPSEIYSKPTIEHLRANLGVVIPEITRRTQIRHYRFHCKTIQREDQKQKRPRVQSKKQPPVQGEERVGVYGDPTLASSPQPSQSSSYRQFLSCARPMRSFQSQTSTATSHSPLLKKSSANKGLRSSHSVADNLSTSLKSLSIDEPKELPESKGKRDRTQTWVDSTWH